MSTFNLFLVVFASAFMMLATLAQAGATHACDRAFTKCDFRFDTPTKLTTFKIAGEADIHFTPRIISKDRKEYLGQVNMTMLGVVNSNDIAPEAIIGYTVKPITKLNANPSLEPMHIKPAPIEGTVGSGLVHEALTRSQRNSLRNRCLRVYFTEYQLLNHDDTVKMNMNNIPKEMNKCVVFRTK